MVELDSALCGSVRDGSRACMDQAFICSGSYPRMAGVARGAVFLFMGLVFTFSPVAIF